MGALARADGNIAKAAELLGVSRPTGYDLLHRHGIRSQAAAARAARLRHLTTT